MPLFRTKKLSEVPRHDAHGSAEFAGLDFKDTGEQTTGVHLGQLKTQPYELRKARRLLGDKKTPVASRLGPVIYSKPETNTLICAPAGSGKGTTVIIPTLLLYEGSVFTIDPKGENTAVTLRRRQEMGQTIHVLNPWGLHGLPGARINPVDLLDPGDPQVVSNATFITDLCVIPPRDAKDPFWDSSARALIRGLLLYITGYLPAPDRTLATLRRLVTQSHSALGKTFDQMAASELFSGALAEAGNQFREMESKTLSNVLSTAQAHTDFLTDPTVKAALDASDFSFSELKQSPTTVYVILPAYALETQSRWLRLMVGMALTAMERGPRFETRALFLLDEFAALGPLKKVQTGIATLRGFGVDMALILQDLNQLRLHYPQGGDTILSNCAYKHFMRISDKNTADYVSAMLGITTVQSPSLSWNQSGRSKSVGLVSRPLRTPDELLGADLDTGFLVKAGSRAIMTAQVPYFATGLADLADPNPMHPE